MTRALQNRNWKLFAAIGLLLCLVALLAHPAQALSPLALLLLPVLLFGLVPVPRSLWAVRPSEHARAPRWLARAALFQRPPPRFSR